MNDTLELVDELERHRGNDVEVYPYYYYIWLSQQTSNVLHVYNRANLVTDRASFARYLQSIITKLNLSS